jgi:hypothetical protein
MKSRKRSGALQPNRGAKFIWLLFLCSVIFPSVGQAEPDLPAAPPPTLDALIQEALARSPMITSRARADFAQFSEVCEK